VGAQAETEKGYRIGRWRDSPITKEGVISEDVFNAGKRSRYPECEQFFFIKSRIKTFHSGACKSGCISL